MLSHRRGDSRIARHCVGTGVPDGPSQVRSIDKTEDSSMTRTNIVPYFILPTSQQKVKKKRPRAHDSQTLCRSMQYVKKKNQAEAWFSVFALPIFTGSDASAACGGSSEGAACAAVSKMQARFVRRRICRAPQTETGGPTGSHLFGQRKNLHSKVEVSVFALPIFTARHQATIVGVHVLNFCVRDGNRWTHMTINTNFW